ncbi:PilZ domain-containing protein [Parerythrobacter lacustris]|uniref:PilZ domain-containing protein n=1 Tax=Parerythrobacter lacustris TaxID=2969984 RepID=A0ABT1XL79_9SPHN|nr:PilZ domain-containing protein [Parerythrobacter lacustris]MCR2832415.1 PilZ domain-containing protein [Parerythrobacter lacustris]
MNLQLPEMEGANGQPVAIDDRAAPRFTLLIRPGKLHVGEAQYLCVIRDISATGVSIRLFHPIDWRGPVVLELQTGDCYPVEQVWDRGAEAGFRFFDPIEVDSVIGHCSHYPKRDLRFEIRLPVVIQAQGQAFPASVANLSRQGALVESDDMFAIGQAVMLQAKGLSTIEARIRWRKAKAYGLVFDTTFSLQQLALALQRFQHVAQPPNLPSMRMSGTAAERD